MLLFGSLNGMIDFIKLSESRLNTKVLGEFIKVKNERVTDGVT